MVSVFLNFTLSFIYKIEPVKLSNHLLAKISARGNYYHIDESKMYNGTNLKQLSPIESSTLRNKLRCVIAKQTGYHHLIENIMFK